MQRFLSDEGITFLPDGGDTVRQTQMGFGHFGETILDWVPIAMWFTITQLAKGLADGAENKPPEKMLTWTAQSGICGVVAHTGLSRNLSH